MKRSSERQCYMKSTDPSSPDLIKFGHRKPELQENKANKKTQSAEDRITAIDLNNLPMSPETQTAWTER